MTTSLILMEPVLVEYFRTGLVPRLPTWVLSVSLMLIAFLMGTVGLILDSLARSRAEQLRIHYLSLPQVMSPTMSEDAQADRDAARAGRGRPPSPFLPEEADNPRGDRRLLQRGARRSGCGGRSVSGAPQSARRC